MTTSQRLAFVCPRFAHGATVGGAETLLKNLAIHAASMGRSVSFLTTCAQDHFSWRNETPPGTRRIDGLDVTFFPVDESRDLEVFLTIQDRISRRRPVTPEEELQWLRNSVNSSALYQHLRDYGRDYDRILAGPYLFGLTYFASQVHPDRTVLVPCLHDEPFAYLSAIADMFRGVRGHAFNAEPEQTLGCELYGLDRRRTRVVGMGLDAFESDGAAFRARHRIQDPYVLYSGRREPLKGTPLLIDYMAAFNRRTGKRVRLVLTGSGRFDVPSGFADAILDLGFVTEEEKRQAMAGAIAFCHPSVNESLGIVLLEAWMARTPALVHSGSAVLSDQCRRSRAGLWFRAYPEFEEELLLLLENADLRRAMGDAGRAFVLREYSWAAVEKRLASALDEL